MSMANPIATGEHSRRVVTLARRHSPTRTHRPLSIPTARPKTHYVYSDDPTQPARTERVEKVSYPLDEMWRRGQLTDAQYVAGEMYRRAWQTCHGKSMGGTLDLDRVRSRGEPGLPFAITYLKAAELLAEAKLKLYPSDRSPVEWFVVHDKHFGEIARLATSNPKRSQIEEIGRCVKHALNMLTDLWGLSSYKSRQGAPVRPYHNFDPAESAAITGEVMPSPVAHATRKDVKISGSTN